MRWLLGFVLLLLALGTLRTVGCGDEARPPECSTDEDCDDQNACTDDFCRGGWCSSEPVHCDDYEECTYDGCDPDTGCSNVAKPNCTLCGGCAERGPCPGLPLFTCCIGGYSGICWDGECLTERPRPPPPPDCDGIDDCTGDTCPCTECGIRNAVAAGGGPYTFDCDGPTTVVTKAAIVIATDVTLDGESNLTVDANQAHRVFSVGSDVTAELRGVTVTGGLTYDGGGGIYNDGTLTLTNSTVSGNAAQFCRGACGGGIYNDGILTLTNSTVSGNTTACSGGGIENRGRMTLTNSTVSGNAGRTGGGIYNDRRLTLTNSTVSGNTAGENGGGLRNTGTLTLTTSTVSGNTAEGGGGGIDTSFGDATLTNSTVSGNTARFAGSAVSGRARLNSSLVDGDCHDFDPVTSNGHNIESPGDTCGFDQPSDQVNVTAEALKLGPLQDNGGPTETHALLPGSVAIDVIPEADCEVDTDQRGEPRDSMCDVGAFEVQP